LSFELTGLAPKSSAETWMSTVPAACAGVVNVHLVLLVQVAAIKVDDSRS
jgi:hypothetical protein